MMMKNIQTNDSAFIHAALGQISIHGRRHLKHIAQALTLAQNNPGYPIPDKISQQIMRDNDIYDL